MKAVPAVPLPTLTDVNDLGKPWRWEEDGLTVTRTSPWSPPGCHPVGCGLKLYVDDEGKLVKVEGDENHPITQGRLCVRCLTLKDYIYNPSRITYPMKRAKEFRGQNDKWERCDWEEAIDIIEENYRKITAEFGRESIVCFAGTGREGGTLGPWHTYMLCSPNYCYTQSGYACYVPRMAAAAYNIGSPYPEIDYAGGLEGRFDDPKFEVPECIVVWGKAPLASNPDGFFGHALCDLMRRGSRLIVVDPRANWLSTRADYHLRLRPGTDTALAMAMLNVIIEEDLYDHDFVEYWCYGFEELAERVKTMPAEKAAEICGIDVDKIKNAARMYANASPASIQWGLAFDQKANGMQLSHSVICLMAITGNLDIPGGQILGDASAGQNESGFGFEEGLGKELIAKMIGLHEYPAYANTILNAHADLTLRAMETGEPYPIKMGFYAGNNLMSCTSAEPKRWHDAMVKTLDFCFTVDCFMTPSAQATCDIFLPLATSAEEDGVEFAHYGATPVGTGFMNKALSVGECKTDMETCLEVGKRLNPHMWKDYNDVYDFIDHLRLFKKHHFKDVAKEVYVLSGCDYYKYETGRLRPDGQLGFNTPSGRVELYSTIFQQFGEDPLPYYEEPAYSPVQTPELMKDYPFVLTTGARTFAFFHSENRQIPFCRELNPDPLVEINPKRAAELGIADGQWCEVWNQFGSCKMKAKVSAIVDENTLHCQHGWWFPEDDPDEPNLYGTFRSNVNNLVPNFHFGKLGFGAPFKCMIANIKPIKESYDTDMQEVWTKFKREDQ
ncbi:MAG: molybdopterin-dependent oxidoreductase [Actinobacteria bacterium]|nr:molybdopterin-dependent oxidoreductase [Actinomycetota bacterium]